MFANMDLKSVLMGELIGQKVAITKSTSRQLNGLTGKIVDETMNTFVIETPAKEVTVQKKDCSFQFGSTVVDGKELQFRPEERIRKYWRKFNARMQRHKLPRSR